MDNNLKQKKFWFDFLLIFILGNFMIGFFEAFSSNKICHIYLNLDDIKDKNFYIRLLVFIPAIVKTICISYLIYSLTTLGQNVQYVQYKFLVKSLLILFCLSCVITLSWFSYSSPISYFTSHIYNNVIANDFSQDFLNCQIKSN